MQVVYSVMVNKMLDIKIINGSIIDGSGAPAYKGDVGIEGDKIVAIGDLKDAEAKKVIDATGKFVTPGFIDIHTHSDYSFLVSPDASARLYDGVTTDVFGNCGIGLAPVSEAHRDDLLKYLSSRVIGSIAVPLDLAWDTMDEYLKKLEAAHPACNVVPLVAQGALRIFAMGFKKGRANAEEMAMMKEELKKAMEAGCVGLSSGLIYIPGDYTSGDELAELCEVLEPYNGYYVTHMRNEGTTIWEAIDEAIDICKHANIRLHISHLKLFGSDVWGQTDRLFAKLDAAKKELKDCVYDCYPYIAGASGLCAALPPWVFEGGMEKMLERLTIEEERAKIRHDMENGIPGWQNFFHVAGGFKGLVVTAVDTKEGEKALGRNLQELADEAGMDGFDWMFQFLIQERGRVQVLVEGMREEDMLAILTRPETLVGSDSMSMAETGILGVGNPHPRAFATHSHILRQYVREEKRMPLELAIRKFSALAAAHLGLDRRGEIKEGYYADVLVMDYENVKDNSTYMKPKQYSSGFDTVIVNGAVAIDNGVECKAYSGRVLRHGK